MNTFEILEIIISVLGGLAFIGLITGGSKRKWGREEFERNQDRIDADFKSMQLFNAKIAYKRDNLLKERNEYFEAVTARNRKMKELRGNIWGDLNKAMFDFDERHKSAWYVAGMVPPSFANNIGNYNEMVTIYDDERIRNGQ